MYIDDASHCNPLFVANSSPNRYERLINLRSENETETQTPKSNFKEKPDENVNVHNFFYLRQNTRNGLHFTVNGI